MQMRTFPSRNAGCRSASLPSRTSMVFVWKMSPDYFIPSSRSNLPAFSMASSCETRSSSFPS